MQDTPIKVGLIAELTGPLSFMGIADANVTTLIAGVVLFLFGTGPIKGFAVVLSVGILTTLFTALMGSRTIIGLIWGRRSAIKRLPV